ncbi:MAG: TiaS agmantine-binding domain-containing protein, partial [Thermoplasmata archaeon]
MSLIGIDDTDSPQGGCTTYVLTEVIRAAQVLGLDLLGDPRLVRLNPNVPFRTRGNAALSARFGHGQGPARVVGELPEGAVRSFRRGRPPTGRESRELVEAAWQAVRTNSRRGEPGTDPALIAVARPLPAVLYWSAVSRLVPVPTVERLLRDHGAEVRTEGSRQGLVGAAAALAWPGRHPTFEFLAYRSPDRWGTARRIDPRAVERLEASFPELFLCRDARTRRILIVPHTPCPILFGLRAVRAQRLRRAARGLTDEPIGRWLIFRTNQGTGDHLARMGIGSMKPFGAAAIEGVVDSLPTTRRGGHVEFQLRDRSGGRIACLAFEPTKTLPRLAGSLRPGDRLLVWGGRGADPVLRVEGIRLLSVVPRRRAGSNPLCPFCGHRTKSLGEGRGFRCPRDRSRLPPESRPSLGGPAAPRPGWYHPT